jgi:diguanylate cyclase
LFAREGTDHTAAAVARAIVALASSLGMRTVAEGVETLGQWHALDDLRCDEVQGFLFSAPVDAQTLAGLLDQGRHWAALRLEATTACA